MQEDWQVAVKNKVKPETEKQPLVNNLDKKQEEAQKRELKKQINPARQAIFDEIIATDTERFLKIFEAVKENSGSMKNTIFPPNITPMEIFKNNGMAANLLKIRLEELYPEKFDALNQRIKDIG